MEKVIVQASMSLDGNIADLSGRLGPLFDRYSNGDVEFTGADPDRVFRLSAPSAEHLRVGWANIRVGVIGRRLFDHLSPGVSLGSSRWCLRRDDATS